MVTRLQPFSWRQRGDSAPHLFATVDTLFFLYIFFFHRVHLPHRMWLLFHDPPCVHLAFCCYSFQPLWYFLWHFVRTCEKVTNLVWGLGILFRLKKKKGVFTRNGERRPNALQGHSGQCRTVFVLDRKILRLSYGSIDVRLAGEWMVSFIGEKFWLEDGTLLFLPATRVRFVALVTMSITLGTRWSSAWIGRRCGLALNIRELEMPFWRHRSFLVKIVAAIYPYLFFFFFRLV